MYLKTIKILIATVLVTVSFPLSAQKVTFSPYSRYGIGDIYQPVMGHNVAMGGVGIARCTSLYLNSLNPAGNAELPIQRFIFDVGMDTKYTNVSSATASQKNNNTTFKYLTGAFAAKPWWNYTFSMRPYSSVGYSMKDTTILQNQSDGAYYGYFQDYSGSGGLSNMALTTSFTFLKMFSLGVKASYLWGSLDRYNNSRIISSSSYAAESDYTNRYILHGFSYEFGAMVSKSIISSKDSTKTVAKINAGFTYGTDSKINSRNELLFLRKILLNNIQYNDTICNDTLTKGHITIPGKMGVGVSVELYNRFTIAADYTHQDWTSFDIEGENHTTLQESTFLGAGVEFVYDKYSTRFFRTIHYRAGFHTEDTYLQLNGTPIKNQGITFGVGMPLRSSMILNVACDMGYRGTTDNNLYKEKYFLMHFNVTIHDVWFVKRKFQ